MCVLLRDDGKGRALADAAAIAIVYSMFQTRSWMRLALRHDERRLLVQKEVPSCTRSWSVAGLIFMCRHTVTYAHVYIPVTRV